MLSSEFDPRIDPMERTYHLTTKVKVVTMTGKQGEKDTGGSFKVVVLVPEQNDETTRFFAAWLADTEKDSFECLGTMGYPIYGSMRLSVCRGNKTCHEAHLFVMSKGVEDILVNKDGEKIQVNIERGTADASNYHESDDTDTDISIQKMS